MDTTPTAPIAVVAQWRKGYARLPVPYTHAVELTGADTRVVGTFPLPPGSEAPEGEVFLELDPHDPSCLEGASGLLLPGGGDIDPEWYGCPRHPRTHNVSHRRDRFELTLLEEALERDIPVLAICHGMQLLNVHLGGTLDQHLADRGNVLQHDRDRPRAEPAHGSQMDPDSPLAKMVGSGAAPVNSHHHQGLARVGEGLEEIAWADDGVLEGVYAPDFEWVVGVQWHPEAMAPVDPRQLAIFEHFVAAAGAGSRSARSAKELSA